MLKVFVKVRNKRINTTHTTYNITAINAVERAVTVSAQPIILPSFFDYEAAAFPDGLEDRRMYRPRSQALSDPSALANPTALLIGIVKRIPVPGFVMSPHLSLII